ncbi:DUF6090 family protein [Muriicola sp.]|uniref:DUF6090 family protein n=1 Tax=Muriicola sp. TaxID=2020856 RepID=UPI003C75ACF8
MEKNKTGKYLKYAIGEILLVVIGILIALSINNWNSQRLDAKKERRILLEIQENLKEDLQNIDAVLRYNDIKIKAIDSAYQYMSMMNENPHLGQKFSYLIPVISSYELFSPIMVAFINMTSSGNIDILSSDDLRKQISRYYSNDGLEGIQGQLIVTTQSFLNEVAPKMMNKNMMKSNMNLDFDVISAEEITVHKDPHVLSDLFVMKNKTLEHDRKLHKVTIEIKSIIESIDDYIDEL